MSLKKLSLPLLALAALILCLYPYWPESVYQIRTAMTGPHLAASKNDNPAEVSVDPSYNQLVIPAIRVDTPVLEGEDISILDRKEGTWHQTGDIISSNFVIAGHRFKYLPPNTSTFYNLNKLKLSDNIFVYKDGVKHQYSVAKIFEVPNNQTEILNSTATPQLTLYTCVDASYEKRLVVIAYPS